MISFSRSATQRAVRASGVAFMMALALLASARDGYAQAPSRLPLGDGWSVAAFAGFWAHAPTSPDKPTRFGQALDCSVERRVHREHSESGSLRIRAQVGWGRGTHENGPGFDYRRLTLGVTRELKAAGQPPFSVYLAAGAGGYRITSRDERSVKPAAYGAIGLDVALGRSRSSIAAEYQLETIGRGLYALAMLGARFHF